MTRHIRGLLYVLTFNLLFNNVYSLSTKPIQTSTSSKSSGRDYSSNNNNNKNVINGIIIQKSSSSIGRVIRTTTSSSSSVRPRRLEPPFPNGNCGGKIITIPPEDTFGVDVNLANINLGGDLVLPPRAVKVWLPPDYEEQSQSESQQQQQRRQRRHPVLYTHDGENAIEDINSWTGASWRMAGALTRMKEYGLMDATTPLPIVVLLPSQHGDLIPGVRRRHLEYGDYNFPFAQAHADFVAKTIKPLIDNRFATDPSPESTFAIGSSLGGQASLHLLLRHPDLFGGVACMSPAFGPAMYDEVTRMGPILRSKKIYLDIGGDMNDIKVPFVDLFDHLTPEHWWNPGYFWLDTQLQFGVDRMHQTLQKAGVDHVFLQFPGGRHNERAWAQRIHKPLLYLFQ